MQTKYVSFAGTIGAYQEADYRASVSTKDRLPFFISAEHDYVSPVRNIVFVIGRPPRIANLHAGAAWMSDDFDVPLSEDFLTENE